MNKEIWVNYENYKGGINNLQIARIFYGYSLEKVFTSKIGKARKYAEKYIKLLKNK